VLLLFGGSSRHFFPVLSETFVVCSVWFRKGLVGCLVF
jgi:hypothetical protein